MIFMWGLGLYNFAVNSLFVMKLIDFVEIILYAMEVVYIVLLYYSYVKL